MPPRPKRALAIGFRISGHLLGRSVGGCRHLEEELLEIARCAGKGSNADARGDGAGEKIGRAVVVPAEAELDEVVARDACRRHSGIAGEVVARRGQTLGSAQDGDADHGAVSQPALDVRDTSLGENATMVDDRDGRAELLELGEDVAADDDRLAEGPELPEELPELDAGPRVESGCRLV